MALLPRLLVLFLAVPLLELWLLVEIGSRIGVLPTVALVVLTGIAGAALARREGLRTFTAARAALARGEVPGNALLDGLAILVGGALLLTPGILTDLLGFSLLLPPTRAWFRRRAARGIERRIREGTIRVSVGAWGTDAAPPHGEGARAGTPAAGGPPDGRRGPRDLDPDKEITIG